MASSVLETGTIHLLPIGIQLDILKGVSTPDLLNFRLVSSCWKALVSQLCRQRRVRFAGGITDCSPLVFRDLQNLPWSSISLSPGVSAEDFFRELLIAQTFGVHIRSLQLTTDIVVTYGTIIYILSCMPNLQEFLRTLRHYQYPVPFSQNRTQELAQAPLLLRSFPPEWESALDLSRLQNLEVSLGYIRSQLQPSDLAFLEFILKKTKKLKRIAILPRRANMVMVGLDSEQFTTLATLIFESGATSIQIPYCSSPVWKQLPDQCASLQLELIEPSVNHEHFLFLEESLGNSRLSELSFEVRSFSNPWSTIKLHLPVLPTLTTLRIEVYHFVVFECRPSDADASLNFHPLTPERVPNLVRVTVSQSCCPAANTSIEHLFNGQFNSVRELKVLDGKFGGGEKCSECFPSVELLQMKIRPEEMAEIGRGFRAVTQLKLEVWLGIWFGRPCGDNTHGPVNLLEIGTVVSYLKEMKALTKLTVQTLLKAELLEMSVFLFTTLHPLDLTLITNGEEISEDCISKLSQHHRRFEIKPLN